MHKACEIGLDEPMEYQSCEVSCCCEEDVCNPDENAHDHGVPAQAQRAQLPSTSQSQLNLAFSRGWIDDFIFVSINRSDIKPNF